MKMESGVPTMTDNEIIKALECCLKGCNAEGCDDCHLYERVEDCEIEIPIIALDLINRLKAEIERLNKFKSYFDDLYGKGLTVANWHLNGETELFDSFYEVAIKEMEDENGRT